MKASEGRPPGGGTRLSRHGSRLVKKKLTGQAGALTGGLTPPTAKARPRPKNLYSAKLYNPSPQDFLNAPTPGPWSPVPDP